MSMTKTATISALMLVTSLGIAGCSLSEAAPEDSGTASEAPSAPSVLPEPDVPVGMTGIRLDMTDCDGCQIKLQSAPKDKLEWESEWYNVDIGSQWLVMPTKYTQGLSIGLMTPAAPLPEGQQYNLVFNYQGQTVSDQVDAGRIGKEFTQGQACWIGTTQRKVAAALQVNYVKNSAGEIVAQFYTQFGSNAFGQTVETPSGSIITTTGFFACKG